MTGASDPTADLVAALASCPPENEWAHQQAAAILAAQVPEIEAARVLYEMMIATQSRLTSNGEWLAFLGDPTRLGPPSQQVMIR